MNQLKRFQDVAECIKYIKQTSDEDRLILVVSGRLGREIMPLIYNLHQVISVYVYCMDKKVNEAWSLKYSKVEFIVFENSLIGECLLLLTRSKVC